PPPAPARRPEPEPPHPPGLRPRRPGCAPSCAQPLTHDPTGKSMAMNAKRENGLVRISAGPLAHLKPAKVNDQVYRPVDTEEAGFLTLVESVRSRGILEPLTVTLDWVILSGHRRYAAAKAAGLTTVPCQVRAIWSTDPGFLPLLVEYNLQRTK